MTIGKWTPFFTTYRDLALAMDVTLGILTHDTGFAPNHFLGVCGLVCRAPSIRQVAEVDDWILGFRGSWLNRRMIGVSGATPRPPTGGQPAVDPGRQA